MSMSSVCMCRLPVSFVLLARGVELARVKVESESSVSMTIGRHTPSQPAGEFDARHRRTGGERVERTMSDVGGGRVAGLGVEPASSLGRRWPVDFLHSCLARPADAATPATDARGTANKATRETMRPARSDSCLVPRGRASNRPIAHRGFEFPATDMNS